MCGRWYFPMFHVWQPPLGHLPAPPAQLPSLPAQPQQVEVPPVQPAQIQVQQAEPPLNWSHFKPEFAGRLDKDVEAHLLRTND